MTIEPNDNDSSTGFDALASEFSRQIREGNSPDVDEIANRNPSLAPRIRRLFPILEMMENRGDSHDWSEVDLPNEAGPFWNSNGNHWQAPERLGDYRLIRQIGCGGMGIVYEAEQESLGRRVAIKILPPTAQLDKRRLKRFASEAKASAVLHHTNIVPVFGIGHEDGLSFFVMQYINGQPLNRVLHDLAKLRDFSTRKLDRANGVSPENEIARSLFGNSTNPNRFDSEPEPATGDQSTKLSTKKNSPQPSDTTGSAFSTSITTTEGEPAGYQVRNYFNNVARIGTHVAEALEHAHSHGILHRDIKPSNLMLDDQGAVWVTDFGLAKSFDSPDITETGEVVGTLRYMAPEQLHGNASTSSDIFGLGMTLYEMLTLQPAYPGVDRKRLLERVTEANPVSPRSIDSRIPRDLETIVMKCIQNESAKRYANSAEVAADLNRYLEGEPIEARRIGLIEKSWKWCCRRPTLAGSLAALLLSILLGVAGFGWQYSNTLKALTRAQTEQNKAQFANEKAQSAKAKANENYTLARNAVVQLTSSISNEELLTSPDLLPVRKKLLLKALDYQVQFVERRPEDVQVKLELAEAYRNLASVASELNEAEEAKLYLADSRSILSSLLDGQLEPAERERAVICHADTFAFGGQMELRFSSGGQSALKKAVATLLDGREVSELSNHEALKLADYHRVLGKSFNDQNVGMRRPIAAVTKRALEHYTKSFELTAKGLESGGTSSGAESKLASDLRQLGSVNRRLGNKEKAFELYSASVDRFRKLVASAPENTDYRFGLARALSSIAYFHDYTKHDQETALMYYAKAIEEHRKLTIKYPSVPKFSQGEAKATMNCAMVFERLKQSKKAFPLRARSLELFEKDLLFTPNDPILLSEYGKALAGMGLNHAKRRERSTAIEYFQKAEQQHRAAIKHAPLYPTYRVRLVRTIIFRGEVYERQDNDALALETYLSALETERPDSESVYLVGRSLLLLAHAISRKKPANSTAIDAEQVMKSAKAVFTEHTRPKYGTRGKILADGRLKRFVASDLGTTFMEWFETNEQRFANASSEFSKKSR